MKVLTKIVVIGSLSWSLYEVANAVYLLHRRKVREAYRKGRTDCVDDFVKGFAFTNGKEITIESAHNGSITVRTIRTIV